MTDRALSPVVGTLVLVAVVVAAAGALAASPLATPPAPSHGAPAAGDSADAPPPAAFSLSAVDDRVAVTYERGPPIRTDRLRVRLSVDGDPLTHQPPVPFFAARGFRPGPTGPFNRASDGAWTAGETAALAVAGTNDPTLAPGRTVTVTLVRRGSSRPVATLTAVVGSEGAGAT